jgi:hypothetical protein
MQEVRELQPWTEIEICIMTMAIKILPAIACCCGHGEHREFLKYGRPVAATRGHGHGSPNNASAS